MKNMECILGLIALLGIKVASYLAVWCCVVGALALIGAMRVLWVWRSPPGSR